MTKRTVKPAKEIRGSVKLPSNPDMLPLVATVAALARTQTTVGPLTQSPEFLRHIETFASLVDAQWNGDRVVLTARADGDATVELPDGPLYCRDFVVCALLASSRKVRLRTVSESRLQRWAMLATRARCDLNVERDDQGVRMSLKAQVDAAIPSGDIAHDDLHAFLGLALGLRKQATIALDYQPSTPLRNLLPCFGHTFEIRSGAERATDPIAKRILRMKGKPLTMGGAQTFSVAIDCSTPAAPTATVDLPGDDILGSILLAAKTLVQRGNLVIENFPLETWASTTVQVLRRMGCNPSVQEMQPNSFGQSGMVQLQRFAAAGRKVECSPQYQFEMQLPAMMVAALFAEGESVFRGLSDLRADSPDSVLRILSFLRCLSAHHGEMPDGVVLRGAGQYDGFDLEEQLPAHMAGAWAVAALKCIGESSIDESPITARWPDFFELLDSVCEYRS